MPASSFREIARLVTVEDVCTPFIAILDDRLAVPDICETWQVDWCAEAGLDPMEQIALVTNGGVPSSWIGFDMLLGEGALTTCAERISADMLLTADTPLLTAVGEFSAKNHPFFLIMKGSSFIGWVSYQDLHKPPLRMCLFAILMNIEGLLLEIGMADWRRSVAALSAGRRRKALEIYGLRGYPLDKDGAPHGARLLECTAFIDKLTIMKGNPDTKAYVPALTNRPYRERLEKLRNELAHPGLVERSSSLLVRSEAWQFIKWAEALEAQLISLQTRLRQEGAPPWR